MFSNVIAIDVDSHPDCHAAMSAHKNSLRAQHPGPQTISTRRSSLESYASPEGDRIEGGLAGGLAKPLPAAFLELCWRGGAACRMTRSKLLLIVICNGKALADRPKPCLACVQAPATQLPPTSDAKGIAIKTQRMRCRLPSGGTLPLEDSAPRMRQSTRIVEPNVLLPRLLARNCNRSYARAMQKALQSQRTITPMHVPLGNLLPDIPAIPLRSPFQKPSSQGTPFLFSSHPVRQRRGSIAQPGKLGKLQ